MERGVIDPRLVSRKRLDTYLEHLGEQIRILAEEGNTQDGKDESEG